VRFPERLLKPAGLRWVACVSRERICQAQPLLGVPAIFRRAAILALARDSSMQPPKGIG